MSKSYSTRVLYEPGGVVVVRILPKKHMYVICSNIYTAQKKYDYMSLYAFFCYADLYIIVEYGIFLKQIQFPVQRGANREATTIVEDTAAR